MPSFCLPPGQAIIGTYAMGQGQGHPVESYISLHRYQGSLSTVGAVLALGSEVATLKQLLVYVQTRNQSVLVRVLLL